MNRKKAAAPQTQDPIDQILVPWADDECPVITVRKMLGMARIDVAVQGYYNESLQGNVETGRYTRIPECVLKTLGPYLPEIGETEESLQTRYVEWRGRLGKESRRKADRFVQLLRIHPGLEGVGPNDTALIESFLTEK